MSQLILDFGPLPPPTLENFASGRNAECVAALRLLLQHLGRNDALTAAPTSRFIYIWGPAGAGKSHLATALRAERQDRLTVVDDCHLLNASSQRDLFHRFDVMIQSPDLALVAFGDQPPARLPVMPELASRLGWGIVFLLEPLDDDDLEIALKDAATARGLPIGDEVVTYLLRHTRRDMGGLKALLDRLDRLSLQSKRPVTLPLLKALLDGGGAPSGEPAPAVPGLPPDPSTTTPSPSALPDRMP